MCMQLHASAGALAGRKLPDGVILLAVPESRLQYLTIADRPGQCQRLWCRQSLSGLDTQYPLF